MTETNVMGTIETGTVIDDNERSYIVQIDGESYKLSKEEVEKKLQKDDEVTGFIYENQNHKKRMTTKIPDVQMHKYDFGEVVDTRRDLGVFVNIGLEDKDIVVSLDDLPDENRNWPQKGDTIMIKLTVDNKNRVWGKLADLDVYNQLVRSPSPKMMNKNIDCLVIANRFSGTYVLTDDYYMGFIHPSERYNEMRIGQRINVRVVGISNNRLNLSAKPRAYESISDDAKMILAVLQRSLTHKIPYTDKSSPEDIQNNFGISKGAFKRAAGNLMKSGYIKQEDGYTILIKEVNDDEPEEN